MYLIVIMGNKTNSLKLGINFINFRIKYLPPTFRTIANKKKRIKKGPKFLNITATNNAILFPIPTLAVKNLSFSGKPNIFVNINLPPDNANFIILVNIKFLIETSNGVLVQKI